MEEMEETNRMRGCRGLVVLQLMKLRTPRTWSSKDSSDLV